MQLIDGKKVAGEIKQEIAAEVEKILAAGGRRPHLAAILVGHDGGSETYVAMCRMRLYFKPYPIRG